MANISDEERKKRLLATLPKDGSGVANRTLIEKLGWSADLYFKIRDELVTTARVQIGRGRGGSVRLSAPSASPVAPARPRKRNERTLYPQFFDSLKVWATGQGWTEHLVQQTSDQGSRRTGGRFTRPDFVVIGFRKYEYTPGIVRDIETFEVKPLGAPIESVFEAAAHSRAATKSYLALQVEDDNPVEDDLVRLETECQRFGVGLIVFRAPEYKAWDFRIDPIRNEPDPERVESFIRDQVAPKHQERIRKWMR